VLESVEPHPAPGVRYSSLVHPFQTFQCGDYSAKPGYKYTYTVVAMYGDPGSLEQRTSVSVNVNSEPIEGATHSVYFNRGSPATQECARRFLNKPPSEEGPAAYAWLSHGLVEGIIAFIQRATGASFGLKGAFYEFRWPAVLNELHAAKNRRESRNRRAVSHAPRYARDRSRDDAWQQLQDMDYRPDAGFDNCLRAWHGARLLAARQHRRLCKYIQTLLRLL